MENVIYYLDFNVFVFFVALALDLLEGGIFLSGLIFSLFIFQEYEENSIVFNF